MGEQLPPVVIAGHLFCGIHHFGKCLGIKDKTEFTSPGNAAWTFAAYGTATVRAASARGRHKPVVIVLGTVHRTISKAGTVIFYFKLTGAKARRFYGRVKRSHLRALRITLKFTNTAGKKTILTRSVTLKL
jgi:hypothetical protein